MKITSVSWKRSSTLNVGDFESVKIEAGAEAEVEEGDDVRAVFNALKEEVGEQLNEAALEVRRRAKRRATKREQEER